jgi:hypothetical protein
MTKKIALFFSILLHPLLMPTLAIIIILYSGSYLSNIPVTAKKLLIILFISGTFLLPLLMIPLIYMRGIITDLQLSERKQRTVPLTVTLIFYLLTFFLFLRIPVYRFMHSFMLASVISVFITLIVNYRWKISIHMVGLGGLSAFLIAVSILLNINLFPYLILTILASGITGSSRLYLQAHSPKEIYSGYLLGGLVMTGCLMIF